MEYGYEFKVVTGVVGWRLQDTLNTLDAEGFDIFNLTFQPSTHDFIIVARKYKDKP